MTRPYRLLAAVALAVSVGACTGGTQTADTITIGTTDRVSELDPAASYDIHTWEIHAATMGGLLMSDAGGEIQPVLAKELPVVSDDGLTWTLSLVEGLRFGSGRELTADDVVWSIERVRRIGGEPSWFVTSFLQEVTAVDSHTVAYKLFQPTNFFPSLLTVSTYFPLDPTCYPEDDVDPDNTCGGIGKYRIREWTRNDRLVLEANPGSPGEAPATATIVIRYLADAQELRQELEAERIDVAWKTLHPEDLETFRAGNTLRVWEGPSAFKRNLILDHGDASFSDPRVRQALSLLIDRDALADGVYNGTFSPLYSPIPEGVHGHVDTMPHTDPTRAAALLEEAGFTAEKPLVVHLWWTEEHYGDQEGELARAIETQLEVCNAVRVELASAPWSTFKVESSRCTYPAFLLGWHPDYLDLSTSVDFFALSSATSDLCSNYANAEMDELVRAAQIETFADSRTDLYRQIQTRWATDVPTIPLVQGLSAAVSLKGIQGVVVDPLGLLHYDLIAAESGG